MKHRAFGSLTAHAAVAACLLVTGSAAFGCFVTYQRNCSTLHDDIDRTRTCHNGPHAVACGDIVIADVSINDARGAEVGEAGQVGVNMPTKRQAIRVRFYNCSGNVCNRQNEEIRTCQGREATGAACVGVPVVVPP